MRTSLSSLASLASHAHHLARVLAELERERRRTYWLIGRAGEIECFLDDLANDMGRRRLGAPGAARALAEYLDALHRGANEHLRGLYLPCCSEATTSPP
jgi:hypothetical protein